MLNATKTYDMFFVGTIGSSLVEWRRETMRHLVGRGIKEIASRFRKIRNFIDEARRVSIQTIRNKLE